MEIFLIHFWFISEDILVCCLEIGEEKGEKFPLNL